MVEEQKLLEREVFSNRMNSPYIVEVDYNDLKIAEEKYKRREIEKVRINNRDFYVSYERDAQEDGLSHIICVWPCAWGWSGKIDGHTSYATSKFGTLSLLKIALGFCDDLYNLANENIIYKIKFLVQPVHKNL